MKETAVSICIPTYKHAPFLEECIQSIQAQTFKGIEIVISDNASPDTTEEIVRRLAASDARIKYFRNRENIGYTRNIAVAVERASNEVVTVFHSDDVYAPTIVERELEVLVRHPNVGGVFCKLRQFHNEVPGRFEVPVRYSKIRRTGLYKPSERLFRDGVKEYLPALMREGNFIACPSLMTTKTIFYRFGGFTDKYPAVEDLDLWLRLLDDGYELAVIDEFLFDYRRSESQGSSYWINQPKPSSFYALMDDFLRNQPNLDLSSATLRIYRKNKARDLLFAFGTAVAGGHGEAYRHLVADSKRAYLFSPFTPNGVRQRLPILSARALPFVRRFKAALKRNSPT